MVAGDSTRGLGNCKKGGEGIVAFRLQFSNMEICQRISHTNAMCHVQSISQTQLFYNYLLKVKTSLVT